MENLIKVLEIFSNTWKIVLVLVLTIPLFKTAIHAYIQVKLAKINNHNKFVVHLKSPNFEKTLEISSSELKLSDLQDQIKNLEDSQSLVMIESKKEAS